MYLAQNLKCLRERNGEQQKALARLLNISNSTMSKYENGIIDPDLEKIVVISKHYEITLDDLVLKDLRPDIPLYAINLRYLRNKQGFTQENMARRLGYSGKQGYSALENGKVKPNVDDLLLLAECFGVTLDQIVKHDLSKEGTT